MAWDELAEVELAELNIETINAWSSLLLDIPNSRLLLYGNELSHPEGIDFLISKFGNFGAASRIEICSEDGRSSFLNEVDIILTAFPFSRPYCAAEALFNGIPVIAMSMPGRRCQDVADLLCRLDFEKNMVAQTGEAYAKIARQWGDNPEGRRNLRSNDLDRIRKCSVFDPINIVQNLEGAYSKIYKSAANKGLQK